MNIEQRRGFWIVVVGGLKGGHGVVHQYIFSQCLGKTVRFTESLSGTVEVFVRPRPKYFTSKDEPFEEESENIAVKVGQDDYTSSLVLEKALNETGKPLLEELLVKTVMVFVNPDIDVNHFNPEQPSMLLIWSVEYDLGILTTGSLCLNAPLFRQRVPMNVDIQRLEYC